MNKRIAVVLFNLGGPTKQDSKGSKTSTREFLFNLFYDKKIINLPNPFRFLLAYFVALFRHKYSQANYDLIGGFSPLLENTIKQADMLEKKLNKDLDDKFKLFISMRYAYPMTKDISRSIRDFDPDEILALPLYPQFSTTTTESSICEFKKNLNLPKYKIKSLCCFFNNDKFLAAHLDLISKALKINKININDKDKNIIIFSAHSLPQKIIDSGDPYQWQVEETVGLIVKKLKNIYGDFEHIISYQSRVNPVKWLKPFTDDVIIEQSQKNKNLIIVPIAFVSEHLETLCELDIEYKEVAMKNGVDKYIRIEALQFNDIFIDSLVDIVSGMMSQNKEIDSYEKRRLCPENFKKCINV